jgi:epoxyqueuosine reductase
MKNLVERLAENFRQYDAKFSILSTSHLDELKVRFQKFVLSGKISNKVFDKYIKRFKFDLPEALPSVKSIITIAIPQKISIFTFHVQGKPYDVIYPPSYLARDVRINCLKTLSSSLDIGDHQIVRATLPLKFLSANSGLGVYGRNQLSYTEGMGSFCRLEAYFTDRQFDDYDLREAGSLPECVDCSRCVKSCPTKCINGDEFYIAAEKCMTNFNEYEGEFPEWIKPKYHNAIVGCMMCQKVCPLNKTLTKEKERLDAFSDEETDLIFKKVPLEELPERMKDRLIDTELDDYYPMLARNLSVLIK